MPTALEPDIRTCAACGDRTAMSGRDSCINCMRARGVMSPALRRLAYYEVALQHPEAFASALATATDEVDPRTRRTRPAAEVAARQVVEGLDDRLAWTTARAAVQREHEASLGCRRRA